MGCCGSDNIEVNTPQKQFHDMSDEERDKIIMQLAQEDKNLEQEKTKEEEEDPRFRETYDWDELPKKLPVKKTVDERKKRLELWKNINEHGNGYVSFKRLSVQMDKYLKLPQVLKKKDPSRLAFNAACNKYAKYGLKKEDNLIEWMEFRIFLVYLRQYFEYWIMFERMDSSGDKQISLDEFVKAIPLMERWGVNIDNPEKEFKSIDINGNGNISFDEFCKYAIQKSLDLEEDDGFEDEELKNLK